MYAELRIGVAAILALPCGRHGAGGSKGDDIVAQGGDCRVMNSLQLGNDVFDQLHQFTLLRIIVFSNIRSEEHTSELQSLMRISYAAFCLKKKRHQRLRTTSTTHNGY